MDAFPFGLATGDPACFTQMDVSRAYLKPNVYLISRYLCRYDDFSECFELWCKEEPDGASGVYNTVSLHMERLITVSGVCIP